MVTRITELDGIKSIHRGETFADLPRVGLFEDRPYDERDYAEDGRQLCRRTNMVDPFNLLERMG